MVALLLGVTGVKAKPAPTTTTLLEEGSYTNIIEISVDKLVSGATITVYTTVNSSDTPDDRKLRIFYKKNADDNGTSFDDVSDWHELTAGQKSYSFTLASSAYEILNNSSSSNQKLYIGANNTEVVTISKITMTTEAEPTSTSVILSENWTASWTAKTFAAQSSAKIGDVIRFSYSAPGEYSYFQFNILDAYGNADAFENKSSNFGTSIATAADLYFDFEITNISDLKKIQNEGFGIKGDNFTLTSVQLLTYSDSYGYTTITIPEVGYATWSSDKKYDFKSAGLQAYYASDVASGSVTLTPMDITWDYQGYIIKGSKGNHDVLESLTTDGSSYYPNENKLVGAVGGARVFKSKYTDYEFADGDFWWGNATEKTAQENRIKSMYRYIFAQEGSDDPAFYKLAEDYSREKNETTVYYHDLGVNKAYLETSTDIKPAQSGSSRIALVFDDGETTGIQELENSSIEELNHSGNEALKAYYNLNGQRVTNPRKGLYVVNGKKVIIK